MFPSIPQPTRRLVVPVLAWKLGLLVLVLLSRGLLPPMFNVGGWAENTRAPGENVIGISSAYSTWDAAHYLTLAVRGYEPGSPSNAYYPLWPGLVGAAGRLAGGAFLPAAVLLALLLGWAGTLVAHAWIVRRSGPDAADAAVVLLLAWPGNFFTVLPYSESLFLLLAALFLLGLESDRPKLAAVAAFLLPLSRAVGLFAALPGAIHFARRRQWRAATLFLLLPAAGWGAYFAVVGSFTGDPLSGFSAQRHFVSHPSLARLFDPGWWIETLTAGGSPRLHDFTRSMLDRGAFLLVIVTLVAMLRRRDWTAAAFTAPMAIVPAITVAFMSFVRYAAVLLPSFAEAGRALSGERKRGWLALVAGAMLALQLLLLLRHVNFIWAG